MLQNLSAIGDQFIPAEQLLQQQMATTQQQISTGVRINRPSDDPGAIADLLQLESQLGSVNGVIANLKAATGEVNTAESALNSATQLMDQITSLGEQGANSTTPASERSALSQNVQDLLTQLVSISNTQFDGKFVFSGDNPTQPAYQIDLKNANGVDQLNTAPATHVLQDASGATFADALSATQIFDSRNTDNSLAPTNVFAAVNSLRVALSNNDTNGIATAVASVQTASAYLSQQQAFYGNVQDQIQNSTTVAQNFQIQDTSSIGTLRDTNMAAAATDLTREQTSIDASVQAQASIPRTSLFDFLNF